MNQNILTELLAKREALLLDGALATELEHAGCDLDHALWSARIMLDAPEKISAVHRSYLEAGCDIVSSATYQASVPGFMGEGLEREQAEELFVESIRLAVRERDAFAARRSLELADAPRVAVSLGPYGAYLADGSEYRGNYKAEPEAWKSFHRDRMELVASALHSGHGDLIACETLPSLEEALWLAELLEEHELPGWISFSCADERSTCEGQDLAACARALDTYDWVVGIGVNCSAPDIVPGAMRKLATQTAKPLLAYPNSGEVYDVATHSWSGSNVLSDPRQSAEQWHAAGARVIGGCCRTGPSDLARLVQWLTSRKA